MIALGRRRLTRIAYMILVLFLTCGSLKSNAGTVLHIKSSFQFLKGEVTCDEMLAKSVGWIPSLDNSPNGAFSHQHMWIRIQPEQLKTNAVLIIENGHVDTVDLYLYDQKKHLLKTYHSGDRRLFANRFIDYHHLNFYIPKETETILIHSRSDGSLVHPLKLISAENPSYFLKDNSINMIFLGVLLIALIINFMFFLFLKDVIYIYYSIYLIGIGVNYANDLEWLFQFLWPEHPYVNKFNVVIYCMTGVIFFFSEKFLQLKANSKALYLFYQGIYVLFASIAVFSLFSYSMAVRTFNMVFMLAPFLVIISALIIYIRKREVQNLLFLLAWTIYMIALVIYVLSIANVLPYFNGVEKITMIGSTFEIIMLMVAVVYKFNLIREEGMNVKERLIQALYENEKILNDQNILLEEKIKIRTLELEEKNQKLKEQSWLMEGQNKIIESTNRLLKNNQVYWEALVAERTEELSNSNRELVKRNERLEQFSFVAAYNIRGPLSNLLGLSSQYNFENKNKSTSDGDFYLQRMRISGQKLDSVVKALGLILDLDKNDASKKETLLLKEFINEILSENELYMRENEIKVKIDFSQQTTVWANHALLNAVFVLLFSKSSKYRKATEPPLVSITSTSDENNVILEYVDNSQIMEPAYDSFFQIIKNDEGSGLNLVRRQVEFMNGSIELEQRPEGGCKYTITLPKK